MIVRGLLKPEELEAIDRCLVSAVFEDGASTAATAARGAKHNLQLPRRGSPAGEQVGELVLDAIRQSPLIQAALLPKWVLHPIVSRYEPGMGYGPHTDSPLMSDGQLTIRTDVGMTLFLSPPSTYAGGELEVQTPAGPERYRLDRGDAVLYPTTRLHRVLPVTSGVRLAVVTWMQCAVRDAECRELLFQLKSAQTLVERRDPQAPENLALLQVYANLVRRWAEI